MSFQKTLEASQEWARILHCSYVTDLNSSITIFTATMLHLPVSTTHVVSGSIMGVGAAKRIHAVRWGVAQQMVMAWVFTIPCTAIMGALSYLAVTALFG